MGKHKIIKSAAAVALTASVVATAAPGASAASYKTNAKDQLVHTSTGKLVKGWKVFGGKLYKNGKLAPAKKYKIIGTGAAQKLFYGPTLKKGYKTAESKTLLFKDGKLADGWKQAGKNERLYKNGKLDKGYTVYTNVEGDKFLYQNGKLKKGQKTANRGGETLLFVDGKLAKGYVLHEASKTLFNNGKVAEGLVKYPETDGKFYNDGKLANGEINGATYKDGVLVAKDVASVKAINDTTVEVTFKEAQKAENIKAADFKIEGLTVSNAALKQTDSKVVVLTTSKQEAAKEYTITYKENDTKTFVGFNAAIPTAIKSTEVKPYQTSQQAKIGEQVTVKATVTVAEGASKAGIPVTFVIDNDKDNTNGSQGKDQTVEVFTDENGVASYTYTQYAASTDSVAAYATGAPTQRAYTNVYWGVAQPLTVKDVTEGSTLPNKTAKVYKITGTPGKTVNVTFAENYNVTPEKVNYDAKINGKTPFQTVVAGETRSQEEVEVTLDSSGVANFTVTGDNTSVTPVVFDDRKGTATENNRLEASELQVTASTIKFDNIKTVGLTNTAKGVKNAAAKTAKGDGGRSFEATLTDKDGKTAPAGTTVYLTISDEAAKTAELKGKLNVLKADGTPADVVVSATADKAAVYALTTDKNGKVSYTITSEKSNNYATPVVFLNNGKSTAIELDNQDTQAAAETTYFGDAVVSNATVAFYDEEDKPATSVANAAKVVYQTVDQNGFAYAPENTKQVTFTLDTTFGKVTATDVNGTEIAPGNTNNSFNLPTASNGKVEFHLNSATPTLVNLAAVSNGISTVTGKVEFVNKATVSTLSGARFTGAVTAVSAQNATTTINNALTTLNGKTIKVGNKSIAVVTGTTLQDIVEALENNNLGVVPSITNTLGLLLTGKANGTEFTYDVVTTTRTTGTTSNIRATTTISATQLGSSDKLEIGGKTFNPSLPLSALVTSINANNAGVVASVSSGTDLVLTGTVDGEEISYNLVDSTTSSNGREKVEAAPAKLVLEFDDAVKLASPTGDVVLTIGGNDITIPASLVAISKDGKTVTIKDTASVTPLATVNTNNAYITKQTGLVTEAGKAALVPTAGVRVQ